MARPRTFDETEALNAAMHVFWKKGYEDTSMDDLLEAMGIQRGSFYNAFESKRDVYLKALGLYFRHITEVGPWVGFLQSEPGVQALEGLMKTFVDVVSEGEAPHGCFFAFACSDSRGEDPEVQKIVSDGIGKAFARLAEVVDHAKAAGEIEEGVDSTRLAVLMTAVVFGFQTLAAAGIDRAQLDGSAEAFFGLVER